MLEVPSICKKTNYTEQKKNSPGVGLGWYLGMFAFVTSLYHYYDEILRETIFCRDLLVNKTNITNANS